MRKYLLILILLTAAFSTKAQTYSVDVTGFYYDVIDGVKNGSGGYIKIDLELADGSEEPVYYRKLDEQGLREYGTTLDRITVHSLPVKIHTEGWVNFRTGDDAHYDQEDDLHLCSYNNLHVPTATNRMSGIYFDVKITPEMNLSNNGNTLLPDNDRITLSADGGFPASVYNWKYSLDGTNFDPFPAVTNSAGNSTVNISLIDLVGGRSLDVIKNNTFIKVEACPLPDLVYSHNTLTLNNRLSSPHITALEKQPNKCAGEANGSIKLHFDRGLLPGELFNIFVEDIYDFNNAFSILNLRELEPGNTITWPEQLRAGNYKVRVSGKYPESGIATYNLASSHSADFDFAGPDAVNFSTSKRDVYCHGGSDATITINTSGGVGNFMLGYKKVQADDYTWVPFSAANSHTLTGLDTGSYNIKVYDGNHCVKKDASGNEVISTVTINQPAEPIHVDNAQTTNPLAYGYTDGSISVVLSGGTPVGGSSYGVQWNREDGTALTPQAATTNPFTTQMKNIGNGNYILVATDANYALTSGANAAGCIIKDTFTLVEPPPLIVTVSEYQYVSCKNAADGKLYASAQGGIEIPIFRYKYKWFRKDNGIWTDIQQSDSIAVSLKAGVYKIIITDKNNIDKESDSFTLAEPYLLTLALTSTPLDCNASNNGTASAVINGGTMPYHLEWTTGETTLTIANLSQGNYKAFVEDAHGCQIEQQVKVASPNPVAITNPVVKNPTCYKGADGVISYTPAGGTLPYTYSWSNGSTAATLNNLSAGDYTLTLTDSKGCPLVQKFSVNETLPVVITLPQTATLCVGQTFEADATIPQGLTYQWTSPNGYAAATPKASLSNEGVYYVTAVNTDGCIGKDTISITRSNAVVAAEMLVTTQAFTNDAVTIVNISNPAPEKIEWLLPNNNVSIVSTSNELAQLKFTATGRYVIGMRSLVGACEKTVSQPITIVQAQGFDDPGTANSPFIKEFTVGPNPSSGQFTVKISLEEAGTIKLRLVDLNTGAVVHQQQQVGNKQYQLPYNLRLTTGVYSLILETAKEYRIIKVMIL